MFIRYFRRPGTKFCRNRIQRNKCGGYTYDSFLQASRRDGVTVQAAQSRACSANVTGTCCRTVRPASAEHELLRYKNRLEQKEADVFVNHQVLTGIPVFMAPDTLRIVSGECSFFVPLEQVVGVRVVD